MAIINLTIIFDSHILKQRQGDYNDPYDLLAKVNSQISVAIEDSWSPHQIISYLLKNRIIPPSANSDSLILVNDYGEKLTLSEKDIDAFDDSISKLGIQNGDVLRLEALGSGGGTIPYRTYREIQLIDAIIQENSRLNALSSQIWFAVILYTSEDSNLSSYIRKNITSLDTLSNPSSLLFVLEQPTIEWNFRLKKLLGELSNTYFDHLWYRFGNDNFKPIDQSEAYNVAREFGIKPSDLPSVVVFNRLSSESFLNLTIDKYVPSNSESAEEFTNFFRILFTVLHSVSPRDRDGLKNVETELNREFLRKKLPKIRHITIPDKKTILDVFSLVAKLFKLI